MRSIQYASPLPKSLTAESFVSSNYESRLGDKLAPAAAMLFMVTTSVVSPRSVTLFESQTANNIAVSRSSGIAKGTNRQDLLAIARIRELGTYANGWNGPDSISPNRSTVEDAEIFARYLFSIGPIVLPYISASGDGEVNFYWKTRDWVIDLGFFGDGLYSFYARFENGDEILEDGACLNNPLPQEIVELIGKTA
jgi:hypothetical protein